MGSQHHPSRLCWRRWRTHPRSELDNNPWVLLDNPSTAVGGAGIVEQDTANLPEKAVVVDEAFVKHYFRGDVEKVTWAVWLRRRQA